MKNKIIELNEEHINYLKEDYGVYCNGAIMESTTYLFAIDNLTNSKKK